jgi:hypothetical protein
MTAHRQRYPERTSLCCTSRRQFIHVLDIAAIVCRRKSSLHVIVCFFSEMKLLYAFCVCVYIVYIDDNNTRYRFFLGLVKTSVSMIIPTS